MERHVLDEREVLVGGKVLEGLKEVDPRFLVWIAVKAESFDVALLGGSRSLSHDPVRI